MDGAIRLLIVLLTAVPLTAQFRPTVAVEVSLPDAAVAQTLADALNTERASQTDHAVRTVCDRVGEFDGRHEVVCTISLPTKAGALNWKTLAEGLLPAGLRGKVDFHLCPEEGSIEKGWQGCKRDPRAEYEETRF